MAGKNDTTMAMLTHVFAVLFGFLAPLIVWLVHKEKSDFVGRHARQALGFQISIELGLVLALALNLFLPPDLAIIGTILLGLFFLVSIIFGTKGALAGGRGDQYSYPAWTMLPWPFVRD